MIKNYLKIALRKIRKQKLHSFINIGGLALGIACFLIISVYVNHEMSYDNFHKNKQNIYRVCRLENEPSGKVISAFTPHALPKALTNDFPNLKNVVSILSTLQDEIRVGDNKFPEKIMFASPNFFNMFDFPFQVGSLEALSKNINSIIISENLAIKLFGKVSPLGKTVTVHGQFPFIVAGIIQNIPTNSSFQFDAFISNQFLYHYILPEEEKKWYSMGVETFVELPSSALNNIKSQFPLFLKKYLPDYLQNKMDLDLQPLQEIHTNSEIQSELFPSVSKLSLIIFFIVACTILFIAVINFVNLSTALYAERQKEIGMRKVIGANRWQLIQQFLGESILMTFCSFVSGYFLILIILPYFNNYIKPPLSIHSFSNISFYCFAILFIVILGLINGFYPALILSAGKPIVSLNKQQNKIFRIFEFRYLMVTVQFGITIALIFGVLSIEKQISFMKNHDLGFLAKNLIAIPVEPDQTKKADYKNVAIFNEIIRNEGKSHGIVSATLSENVPGSFFPNQFGIVPEGFSNENKFDMVINRNVSDDFINTYKMKIVEGRNFSKEFATDYSQSAIINQTAAKMLGWSNPVGKRFRFAFSPEYFKVIGIIKDIHFKSLQNKIEPSVFVQCWGNVNFVTARLNSNNIQNSINYLKQQWNKIMPSVPFEYHFIEEMYRENYKKEEKILQAISIFATLAVVLASLGLLGLTALFTLKRTKEIGIRKTLGASITNIVLLMSKELIFWVIAANILALPVAFYSINNWLQNFPYKMEITWWMFALPGVIALLIAAATISIHSIKAAIANPVEALRYE